MPEIIRQTGFSKAILQSKQTSRHAPARGRGDRCAGSAPAGAMLIYTASRRTSAKCETGDTSVGRTAIPPVSRAPLRRARLPSSASQDSPNG